MLIPICWLLVVGETPFQVSKFELTVSAFFDSIRSYLHCLLLAYSHISLQFGHSQYLAFPLVDLCHCQKPLFEQLSRLSLIIVRSSSQVWLAQYICDIILSTDHNIIFNSRIMSITPV